MHVTSGIFILKLINHRLSSLLLLIQIHWLLHLSGRLLPVPARAVISSSLKDHLRLTFFRGIVRTLASICFSSIVGRWVDHGQDRLKTLLETISINRISVICASVFWFWIVSSSETPNQKALSQPTFANLPPSPIIKGTFFTLILALGILENLSASGNMMSMERDWILVACSPDNSPYDLTHLNSVMRRIDLICKLLSPILISVVVSLLGIKIGVLAVGGMSACSWGFELFCARHVWNRNPRLQAPKITESSTSSIESLQGSQSGNIFRKFVVGLENYRRDFKNYFSSKVWIPSISLAFLHISSLSYGATFITFLLSVGFSLDLITLARAAGSVVEISSTIITPFGVHYLGKAKNHGRFRGEGSNYAPLLEEGDGNDERDHEKWRTETGLERLGLWGILFQLLNLVRRRTFI